MAKFLVRPTAQLARSTSLALLLAGAVLATVSPRPAGACPCVTQRGDHVEEVAQRTLLVVGDDGLDYVVQVAVEGDAAELGWLIPTPAVPQDPVLVDRDFFERLDDGTGPFLTSCAEATGCGVARTGSRQGGAATSWSVGTRDRLDFTVLSASDGSDLSAWLQQHGFTTSAAQQAVIDRYVDRGWSFVALRMSGEPLTGDRPSIGPVRIHVPYAGAPVFPLHMFSVSSSERVSVLLYVAAEELLRPTPEHYPLRAIDADQLTEDAEGNSNYGTLVRTAIDADGPGFVLEYAGDEPGLLLTPAPDDLLNGKRLVRLYADLPPAQLGADLTLIVDHALEAPHYPCTATADGAGEGCAETRPTAGGLAIFTASLLVLCGLARRRQDPSAPIDVDTGRESTTLRR